MEYKIQYESMKENVRTTIDQFVHMSFKSWTMSFLSASNCNTLSRMRQSSLTELPIAKHVLVQRNSSNFSFQTTKTTLSKIDIIIIQAGQREPPITRSRRHRKFTKLSAHFCSFYYIRSNLYNTIEIIYI